MTITGRVFKAIAETVLDFYGYETDQTVHECYIITGFNCKEFYEAIIWLKQNGYVSHFHKHGKNRGNYVSVHRYGLTQKGWSVAPKYLKCEVK